MWREYNPNPARRRVGDCTVRAITKATGQDWETVYAGVALRRLITYGGRISERMDLSDALFQTNAQTVIPLRISAKTTRTAFMSSR